MQSMPNMNELIMVNGKDSNSKQMTNKTSTEWFTSSENYSRELQD